MAPVSSVPVSQSLPQNSVLLVLDGTEEQVYLNFKNCQKAYLNWNIEHAADKVEILLPSAKVFNVFTTPMTSTFYYAMTYQGRYLVFVIEARGGWLHGYYGINGMYEFKNIARVEPYMNDPRCRRLPFDGNHHQISASNIGKTRIGLCALRDAFDSIWKYNGAKEYPKDFKISFGVIVVHICESMKLCPVFERICRAFEDSNVRKLGIDGTDSIKQSIRSWKYLSGQAMRAIDDTEYQIGNTRKVPQTSLVQGILEKLAILYVDGYFGGIFKHDEATESHWEPLEHGNGVPSFDDIPCFEKHIDHDDGESDGDQQNGQSGGKQKREGDEKGRHHGKSKGKRGGGNRGKRQQGGGGRGGGGRRRGGVTLSAAGFPLIGGWGGGKGKELSMVQNPVGWLMQPKDLVCMYMLMCKDKSPTTRSWNCGYESMIRGGDRLSRTEALKWICTVLLGLEQWYLIEWG